jgi:RNA polymerase sigma-B factor
LGAPDQAISGSRRAASGVGSRGASLGPSSNGANEDELFCRSEAGDAAAREELVERYLPLARRLARRYAHGREPFEDLNQVAGMGLVKAIDRFDPEIGLSFSAYAIPTILGELKRHFRDSGWALHVPQRIQAKVLQVERATDELRRELGRSPSPNEVSKATGASVGDVLEAAEASSALEAVSLEAGPPSGGDGGDSYRERLGSHDERYELIEYEASIEPVLRALPSRERMILHLRFTHDLTQFEIAELLGISQMHVSRLLRRSLSRLRAVAEAETP